MKHLLFALCVSLLFACIAHATILNFGGFEIGTLDAQKDDYLLTQTVAGLSVQSLVTRGPWSHYALQVNAAASAGYVSVGRYTTSAGNGSEASSLNIATTYFRVYFRVDTAPSADYFLIRLFDTSSATKFDVILTSARKLKVRDSAATATTGTTVLNLQQWYRLDIKGATGASAAIQMQIDGVDEINITGNTDATNYGFIRFGLPAGSANSAVAYFDDWEIRDSEFPGAGATVTLRPTGNGNYTSWASNDSQTLYTDVDDLIAGAGDDGNTTYVSTATTNAKVSVTVELLNVRGATPLSINAVKASAVVNAVASGNASQIFVRSGSTDGTIQEYSNTAGYTKQEQLYSTDPATGSPWVINAVNAAQPAVNSKSNTDTLRTTMMNLQVSFVPQAGTPTLSLLGVGQ